MDRFEANRARRAEAPDLRAGAGDLPREWVETIEDCWRVWCKQPKDVDPSLDPRFTTAPDPSRLALAEQVLSAEWAQARARWLALGPDAGTILVENLIRWYILAYDASAGYEVQRAKEELVVHRDTARPFLVHGLAAGAGDSVTRTRIAELLAYLGGGIADVQQSYRSADEKGRIELARALKMMNDRESIPLLIQIAGSRDPWQARAEALTALGQLAAAESAPVFVSALRDRDPSVRKFAAIHAGGLGSATPDLLEALVDLIERESATAPGSESARAASLSLRRLTGVRAGPDAASWRRALGPGAR